MMDPSFVQKEFPELLWISSETLRGACEKVLTAAMNAGGWDETTITRCPIAITEIGRDCPVGNLEHMHDVVRMCRDACDYLNAQYGETVPLDRDTVLASALLHDAGKFTEYTLIDGAPAYSDTAQYLRHPLSGAILAAQYGLPDKVIHAIAVHSFEGEKSQTTAESALVRAMDELEFSHLARVYRP